MEKKPRKTYPELLVKSQKEFRSWLEKNWDKSDGVLVVFYKKDSGKQTFTYLEAVDEALCFGWIDTTAKSRDEESYMQLFTPRKPKGTWTVLNKEKVERLIKEGKMAEGGFKAIEAAKKSGSWDKPVTSPTETKVPKDFETRLKKFKTAYEFFKSLSKTQQYYFIYWIEAAKRPETRERRILASLEKLKKKEKFM